MISFVTTPTNTWLAEHLSRCKERFFVACPFVGDYLAQATRQLARNVNRTLLTRTDLRDFATGASDIGAVCETARLGTKVLSLARLHAKVYIIDANIALVTSANATHSGMRRNWECGVALTDEEVIEHLVELVLSGFGATERPQPWTLSELEKLREPVRIVREAMPPAKPSTRAAWDEHPKIALSPESWARLGTGLPGWTRLVMEAVAQQTHDDFDIHDVFRACSPMIAKRFPANRFPREKMRQQLQRLRDLGILEFRGGGRYRRTVAAQR